MRASEETAACEVNDIDQRRRIREHARSASASFEGSFLGDRLLADGRLGLAPKSRKRAKDKLRQIRDISDDGSIQAQRRLNGHDLVAPREFTGQPFALQLIDHLGQAPLERQVSLP